MSEPQEDTVKSRRLTIDCPYCEVTDDIVFAPPLDSVWFVGPVCHTCSGCKRHYTFVVEVDLSVRVYELASEFAKTTPPSKPPKRE